MKAGIQYASWLLVLPILVAALLNYPKLQQSLQQLLPGWTNVAAVPSVTLPQGRLVGKVLDDGTYPHSVEGFLGIPYALPPVGNLRFANPIAMSPSNQTFEATEFGPR